MSTPDDSLDLLSECKYFTTLDLASGYWQVGMSQDSQEKTAFVTSNGLCNAPATFQRLMEGVLAGVSTKKCLMCW